MDVITKLLIGVIGVLLAYIVMFEVRWDFVYIRIWGWFYKKQHRDVWKK